jgi:hypothetical protein
MTDKYDMAFWPVEQLGCGTMSADGFGQPKGYPVEKPLPSGDQDRFPEHVSRQIICAESATTMYDIAVRAVFGEPLDRATQAILERIPTLSAIYGYVGTEKLVEIVSADLGVKDRQTYRYLQTAITTGWVKQFPHMTNKSITDNRFDSSRDVPAKLEQLTRFRISIGKVVEAQLADPNNFSAGKEHISEEIYVHPVEMALEKRKKIMASKATRVRHISTPSRKTALKIGRGIAAAAMFAIVLATAVAAIREFGSSPHQFQLADKVDGWNKITMLSVNDEGDNAFG